MTARKNRIRLVGALLALVLSLSLGGCAVREGSADDGRLRVVTTLFPYYDFARAVAGDRADVTLLLAPGREAHSFEPTPLDAVTISRADVFIYNGGEGEVWVDDMLDAVGEDIGTVLRMMPAPSPVLLSAPSAPRWRMFSSTFNADSTSSCDFPPWILTSMPTPQASCSWDASYKPNCLGCRW